MPTVEPYRAIHGLPGMTLDGEVAPPYDDASFDWTHNQPRQAFPYQNGAGHDFTGTDPIALPFKLHFLNTLQPGAFPDIFNKWLKLLLDGRPHKLVHPILGPRDVVVLSGSVRLTAQATAGVVVDVKFETTVLDPTKAEALDAVAVNLSALAAAVDTAAKNAAIPYPSQMSATSIFDMVKILEGLVSQGEATALGQLNFGMSILDEMITSASNLDDHAVYPVTVLCMTLWGGLKDAADKLAVTPGRPVLISVVQNETTLDAFARLHGNELRDVVGLNPNALLTPAVPPGYRLRYYG